MKRDYDTHEQIDMFDEYLKDTAELHDRTKVGRAYGYDEREWEAFQEGWNAAKQHYGVEE